MKFISYVSAGVLVLAGLLLNPRIATSNEAKPSAQNGSTEAPSANGNKMTKISLEEARKKAPFKVLEPSYLPKGARYLETRYIEFNGQTYVVLQYEYPGKKIYFQVDEYSGAAVEDQVPDIKEVKVGEYKGQLLVQHGGMSVLRWTQNGTRLVVNGAITEAEAFKVARSFK